LSCLAFGPDFKTRLDHVVSWCVVEIGNRRLESNDSTHAVDVDALIQQERQAGNLPLDFDYRDDGHRMIFLGRQTLSVGGGGLCGTCMERWETLEKFIAKMAKMEGNPQQPRIKAALLWDALKGTMSYRNFAVLTAVYAWLGDKKIPWIVRQASLPAMTLGYKPATLRGPDGPTLLASREDGAKPLTRDQIRTTLDHLERANHFARVERDARTVFFSNRMTGDEMRAWFENRATGKIETRRRKDLEMQARIKAGKENIPTIKSVPTIKMESNPDLTPEIVPTQSPLAPPHHPHMVPANKETGLIESDLKETPVTARARESLPDGEALNQGQAGPAQAQIVADVIAFAESRYPGSADAAREWCNEHSPQWTPSPAQWQTALYDHLYRMQVAGRLPKAQTTPTV
jgi:hypothetical protein